MSDPKMPGLKVLLYVPNVIGYLRLITLAISWWYYNSSPVTSAILYMIFVAADGLDGYAARKLNQCTAFGAWFDVVIDLYGRGMLWCRIYDFGYLVVSIEWLCFVCTHTLGAQWKSEFVNEPFFVKAVMAKGYKTPAGIFAMLGLHGLPVMLYCYYSGLFITTLHVPSYIQYSAIGILSAGRTLTMAVELWVIYSHILYLTSSEASRTSPTNGSPHESVS